MISRYSHIFLFSWLVLVGDVIGQTDPCLTADLLDKAKASVVSVQVYVNQDGDAVWKVGSGFIYDEDGFVITRRSLVREGDSIVVTLTDGRLGKAWIVYEDAVSGTALLKIPYNRLMAADLGSSSQILPESALTILGNSLGTFPSITMGTFKGTRRDGNLIVNAMIPPGNCGSPVLDSRGRVVGLFLGREISNSESEIVQGRLGVALPIERVQEETDRVLKHVRKGKGWIGISVAELVTNQGVRVVGIAEGGPTDRAHIAVGDTIVAFQGQPVQSPTELAMRVRQMPPESEVTFTVLRGGRQDVHTVRIAVEPWASGTAKER